MGGAREASGVLSHLLCPTYFRGLGLTLLLTVLCLWKLVRPGMQIPARMPRAALNPSIPPPNAASTVTSAVGGASAMTQQVNVPRRHPSGSDPCFPSFDGPIGRTDAVCPLAGAAARDDVIALAGAGVPDHVAAAAAVAAASGVTAQLSQVQLVSAGGSWLTGGGRGITLAL